MWKVRKQLITSYTKCFTIYKKCLSLLHMHSCLLQCLVNDLKGTQDKSNSCTVVSRCPRQSRDSNIPHSRYG